MSTSIFRVVSRGSGFGKHCSTKNGDKITPVPKRGAGAGVGIGMVLVLVVGIPLIEKYSSDVSVPLVKNKNNIRMFKFL